MMIRANRQTRIDETIAACTECDGSDFPKRSDCDSCINAVDEEIRNEIDSLWAYPQTPYMEEFVA